MSIRSAFLSHGAPLLALDPGQYAASFAALGRQLADAPVLIVVSPHWMSEGIAVGASAAYSAVHDFGGFPAALYQLRHDIVGDPTRSAQLVDALTAIDVPARLVNRNGVDHGVWMPHRMMLMPNAQPIIPVSLPARFDARAAYAMGSALTQAMPEAIVLGSGGMTHNLREFRGQPQEAPADPRVVAFSDWMRDAVLHRATERLLDYRRLAPHAVDCHPTDEHLMPFFVALGAAGHGARGVESISGVTHGILSMQAWSFEPGQV